MTDWPATASAAFAGIGLLATAWQLRQGVVAKVEQRRLETEGVCASWHPVGRPRRSDIDPDGCADWRYDFFVDNPGRFPISSIAVRVNFPVEVRRVRGTQIDAPTHHLTLVHPVLAGSGQRSWSRTLRMRFDEAEGSLHATTATVTFTDAQGASCTTEWPRPRR